MSLTKVWISHLKMQIPKKRNRTSNLLSDLKRFISSWHSLNASLNFYTAVSIICLHIIFILCMLFGCLAVLLFQLRQHLWRRLVVCTETERKKEIKTTTRSETKNIKDRFFLMMRFITNKQQTNHNLTIMEYCQRRRREEKNHFYCIFFLRA